LLWPAVAAALVSEMAARVAMQFGGMAVDPGGEPIASEPDWATPHAIALELRTVRLRDFSVEAKGSPVLICAPFALHGIGKSTFRARVRRLSTRRVAFKMARCWSTDPAGNHWPCFLKGRFADEQA
jgi:hypothetical protein